jgi:membrane protease YdiL (CAAX protease family)
MNSIGTISPRAAVLIVLVTFLLFLIVGGALYVVLDFALVSIIGELLIAAVPLVYMLCKRVNVSRYVSLQATPKAVLVGILTGLLLLLFDIAITIGLTAVLGTSDAVEESNKLIMELGSSPQGAIQLAIALSLAGFCEEFAFRGFLQTSIANKHSHAVAILVSSIAFGLYHFDLQLVYTLSAFLMGLVLGFAYHHWRSYTVPSVAHATVNLIVLAFLLLPA